MTSTPLPEQGGFNERWVFIKGYEGLYEVSNLGNVRSLSRMTAGRWNNVKLNPGRTLKPYKLKTGYMRVDLSKDGKSSHKSVHRLVAEAFLEPVEGKTCVNHKDSICDNNTLENLEWCTHRENTHHARDKGRLTGTRTVIWKEYCVRGHKRTPESVGARGICKQCTLLRVRRIRAEQRLKLGGTHGTK